MDDADPPLGTETAPDQGPPPAAFPGARLRPTRSFAVAYAMIAVWMVLVVGVFASVPALRVIVGPFGLVMTVAIGAALRQLVAKLHRGGGTIEVTGEGLWAEGRLVLARAEMARADVTRDARGPIVSIQRSAGPVAVVEVPSEREGDALVKALGLDASQASSTFWFDSPVAAAVPWWAPIAGVTVATILVALLLLGARSAALPYLALAFVLTMLWPSIAAVIPSRMSIGLDGLLVRWAFRRELIRFEDLRGIDHDGDRIRLTTADGRVRKLSMRSSFSRVDGEDLGFASRAEYLDAVVARVRAALDARRTSLDSGSATPAIGASLRPRRLGRGSEDVDAWITSLRAMLVRGPTFREALVSPERLWATVEDQTTPPTARAAAAVALGPALGEEDRERMRRAARVIVSPRLRVAIEAAARVDDDGAVEEALAALEEDEARRILPRAERP